MTLSRKLLLTAGLAGFLTACQNAPRTFESMTEEELFAYNTEQPIMQQVICVTETTTSSYIRKRRCQSLDKIINERSSAVMQLDVLNWGVDYNAGIGRILD